MALEFLLTSLVVVLLPGIRLGRGFKASIAAAFWFLEAKLAFSD